jgi:hypothetical protein
MQPEDESKILPNDPFFQAIRSIDKNGLTITLSATLAGLSLAAGAFLTGQKSNLFGMSEGDRRLAFGENADFDDIKEMLSDGTGLLLRAFLAFLISMVFSIVLMDSFVDEVKENWFKEQIKEVSEGSGYQNIVSIEGTMLVLEAAPFSIGVILLFRGGWRIISYLSSFSED